MIRPSIKITIQVLTIALFITALLPAIVGSCTRIDTVLSTAVIAHCAVDHLDQSVLPLISLFKMFAGATVPLVQLSVAMAVVLLCTWGLIQIHGWFCQQLQSWFYQYRQRWSKLMNIWQSTWSTGRIQSLVYD